MGLLSSSKSSKTEYNTNQSAGFSEIGGPVNSVNANNSDVFMSVSDRGAIDRAFTGIDNATARLQDVAGKAMTEVGESQRNALNFGSNSMNSAMVFGTNSLNNALDFGSTSLTKVLDFARSSNTAAQRQVQQTNENFTNKFSEFANRQSASDADRIADFGKWAVGGTLAFLAYRAYTQRGTA